LKIAQKCGNGKGGFPRPPVTLYGVPLLLHPPPAETNQSQQPAPQEEHRGGFGDGKAAADWIADYGVRAISMISTGAPLQRIMVWGSN
jgi:hypothetical protein